MKFDAEMVANLKNLLFRHRQACDRCFRGLPCQEKQALEQAIRLAQNAWKEPVR